MPEARAAVAAALLGALAASPAGADDSVFGIRGLGILGRPVSARSAAAGGFALFDGASALNPASLSRWRAVAGWGVGVPTQHVFESGGTETTLRSTRFPMFGFATLLGQRLIFGATISDYLDRTWSVSTTTDTTLRGTPVTANDQQRSVGGVSDIRVAAAYRLTSDVAVGAGLHVLVGSSRVTASRSFTDSSYASFAETATTDFNGVGFSMGVLANLRSDFAVAGALRVSSRLKASNTAGQEARVAMPVEASFGAQYTPVPGVALAATVGYASWSRAASDLAAAGEPGTRDVWSVAAGLEVETSAASEARLPLRLGYRWRQLPFPVGSAPLDEHAFSAGFGFNLAGGRTTVDLGIERGSRAAGAQSETFTSGFVGLTVRP